MPRKGSSWTPLRLAQLAERQAAWEKKAAAAIAQGKKPTGRPPVQRFERLSLPENAVKVQKYAQKQRHSCGSDAPSYVANTMFNNTSSCPGAFSPTCSESLEDFRASSVMSPELEDFGDRLMEGLDRDFNALSEGCAALTPVQLPAFRNDDGSLDLENTPSSSLKASLADSCLGGGADDMDGGQFLSMFANMEIADAME
jgi:hypothetical protein